MARILVQTNDRRTVLDEGDVRPADISGRAAAARLLGRLERAVEDAERERTQIQRTPVGAIAAASDYREVSG
jgi:hypothetical protein